MMAPTIEYLTARVAYDHGCWSWTGPRHRTGYGQFCRDGKNRLAHRAMFEELVGEIPVGLDLDHLCRNRLCVNPVHLEPVTRQVNLLRGAGKTATKAAQTHCIRGHEFNVDNVYIKPGSNTRGCRICRAASLARRRTHVEV